MALKKGEVNKSEKVSVKKKTKSPAKKVVKSSVHKKLAVTLENTSQVKIKKFLLVVCIIFGVLFVGVTVLAFLNPVFIPSAFIMAALVLFSISYYLSDDNKNKSLIYLLFGGGMALLLYAIIYTVLNQING
ncbi:MAG: hypothetical protein Q4G04_05715 [bacterium]|nr:hypothetical protein [bacterium]